MNGGLRRRLHDYQEPFFPLCVGLNQNGAYQPALQKSEPSGCDEGAQQLLNRGDQAKKEKRDYRNQNQTWLRQLVSPTQM